jgi:condensin-2 complex subunit G2
LQGSKTISQVYGEVLYRSWKDIAETQDNTENSLSFLSILSENVQDLIHNAVHCADAKYFKGLRWVIKSFHDVKRSIKFDDYLVALFEPILWRSLKCANALVRAQSTIIFLDVFPLQQSSNSTEQSDLFLQKQFDQLTSLLKDTDHRVRSPAIVGVSHIIKEYWDILPAATITNLLKFLFESLAFDSSHPNVRLSVLTGINELLDQPLSHLTLRNLLPIIKNLLNDKSEKVRDGFVKMLLKVTTFSKL